VKPPAERTVKATPEAAARAQLLLHAGALVVSVGVVSLVFVAAFAALGPDSLALPLFNSDSGVPVLMSNDTHWDLFHAYYLRQDRFGAWPFFVARVLSGLLRRPVTPEVLHGWATLFVAAGAIPAALLCRPWPGLGLLAYAIAVLVPQTRGSLFELAQVYPWQIPVLFWGWWSIRRAFQARGARAEVGWLVLATFLCCLATWTSVLSGPMLLSLTLLEGTSADAVATRPRRWLLHLLPPTTGLLFEAGLRQAYNRFVQRHFQMDVHTLLRGDKGHLAEHAGMLWLRLRTPPVLGSLLFLAACVAVLLVLRRRGLRGEAKGRRWTALECTVVGALLCALLPLPVLLLVSHWRMNDYAERYLAPTYVFLLYGGLVALGVWLPSLAPARTRGAALAAMTLALCSLVYLVRPQEGANPEYARMRTLAQALAVRAPGEVLLDGYWGTYVLAALAPPGQLLPLPRAGELNRLPAQEESLALARRVVVGHRFLLPPEDGSEPRWLFQYGVLLELDEPRFLSDAVDRFSTYRPRAVQSLPLSSEPPLPGLYLQGAGAEVTLRTSAPRADTAVAVELSCLRLERAPEAWAEDEGGRRVKVEVQTVPGALFFLPPETAFMRALHLSFARAPCRLRGARWYLRAVGH